MWHDIVSTTDMTMQLATGLFHIGLQHPVAATGIVVAFACTTAILMTEIVRSRNSSDPAPPIRLLR